MISPAFEVQYAAHPGPARLPLTEEMLTTHPFRSISAGRVARAIRKAPVRLVRMTRSQPSDLLEHRRGVPDPGVVDQHVDAAEALQRRCDDALGVVWVADVGCYRERRMAVCLQLTRRHIARLEPATGHDYAVAVRGKPTRYGQPDAAAAPGHDRGSKRSLAHSTQYLAVA
jgi:hypothetical protein